MNLKLDENLGSRGSAILSAAGHDVSTVVEQRMQSSTDEQVITVCAAEGRALVTLDLDFANPLRFPPQQFSGIAVLRLPRRPAASDVDDAIRTLVRGLKQEPLTGRLWIVEADRIRIFQPDAM